MEEDPNSTLVDPWNGTKQESFRKALKEAIMSGFALTEAANGAKRFRTKETKVSAVNTIYSLLQCTPDLSSEQCERCLKDAIGLIPLCCDGKEGATILLPSCNVRYEMFPFYNQTSNSKETKPKG
ncbi:Gnk2-like domain containing protein [Trema orientale]|uniref:Gnk2-like domain containing protein n=1 Tax=Trema orientale TaxID=63057 RepID=A0A2P5EFK8_TREOI|nr:Gnk2-like domain containing protein [Trema orientale]